ncbi:hypothetical protein C1336_000090000 [Campylobacter jejuni subsp. jejuni 1336]|nr:hypothetical protein C1336_000090000 [Campylobacter jejuni subsp. jejuni 1336]
MILSLLPILPRVPPASIIMVCGPESEMLICTVSEVFIVVLTLA